MPRLLSGRKGNDAKIMDWGLIAKIAGGGFGIVMLVLAILTAAVWIVSLVARKFPEKSKESETKGRKA